MKRFNFKLSLISLIAIMSGIAIHFATPLTSIALIVLWVIAALFSFIIIIIGLFSKKFKPWYLLGFLPFLVGYGFETGIRNYKHNRAEKLITQIENYKIEHGSYPNEFADLNSNVQLEGLTYSASNDHSNYRIEYLLDKFNREYFGSESKSWGTLGWSD